VTAVRTMIFPTNLFDLSRVFGLSSHPQGF